MSTPQALRAAGLRARGSKAAERAASSRPNPSPAVLWLRERGGRHALRFGSVAAGLLAWHLLATHGVDFILNFQNLPGPLQVGSVFEQLLHQRDFYVDIAYSLRRIGIAYLLATLFGVGIGALMGRSRLAQDLATP